MSSIHQIERVNSTEDSIVNVGTINQIPSQNTNQTLLGQPSNVVSKQNNMMHLDINKIGNKVDDDGAGEEDEDEEYSDEFSLERQPVAA